MESWRESVDRAVLACVLFVVLVALAATLASPHLTSGSHWALVLAGTQLGFAALCALGIRRGSGADLRRPALVLCIVGFGAAAMAVAGDTSGYTAHTLPTNAVQAIQLSVIGFSVSTAAGVGVILATGPFSVAVLTAATNLSTWQAIDRWILPANASIAVLVVVAHLRAAADRADDLAAEGRAAARAALSSANADLALAEARRLLHDEVITALRAIELELPAADVEADARRALSALTATPTPAADLVDALQRGARTRLTTRGTGWSTTPPPRVSTALQRAAAEAVRNVERHARVGTAEVTVDEHDGRYRLTVTDRGAGFDAGCASGFGISESIVGRMEAIGGSAAVESGPDGTTVQLTWPATGDDESRPAGPQPVPRRSAYVGTILAPAVANLYLALRFPGASLAASLAVWAGLTALLALVADRLGRGTTGFAEPRLGTGFVAAASATGYALVAAGLAVAGDGALLGAASWAVGYLSVGLAIAGFGTGLRVTLALIAGLVAVVAAGAAADPTLTLTAPVGALLTPVIVGGVGAVAGVAVRRASTAIARGEALHRAREEERTWRAGHLRAQQLYLDHLETDVVPFLLAVLDRSAPSAAQTAAVLSAQCRDELHLAVPLPESTRRIARAARTRGVTLSIRSSHGHQAIPPAAWQTLEVVLSGADDMHVVTVVPASDADHAVRIVCVPPLSGDIVHGDVTCDDTRTVVLVWPDRTTGARPADTVESAP